MLKITAEMKEASGQRFGAWGSIGRKLGEDGRKNHEWWRKFFGFFTLFKETFLLVAEKRKWSWWWRWRYFLCMRGCKWKGDDGDR